MLARATATCESEASTSSSQRRCSTGRPLERQDTRRDYGERRVIAIGLADGIALTVVYTDRAEAGAQVHRIISARVSSRGERQAYEEAIQRRT
jgi:uncharacterized DUF497 family protein